jgi:hypothetical protein
MDDGGLERDSGDNGRSGIHQINLTLYLGVLNPVTVTVSRSPATTHATSSALQASSYSPTRPQAIMHVSTPPFSFYLDPLHKKETSSRALRKLGC